MNLSTDLEKTLDFIGKEAKKYHHEFITLEHLLYGLSFNEKTKDVLLNVGCDLDLLRKDLVEYFEGELSTIAVPNLNVQPRYTVGVQFVLQFAAFHVQNSGKDEVDGTNILVALFREEDSQAFFLLAKQNITRLDVIRYISHGITKTDEYEEDDPFFVEGEGNDTQNTKGKSLQLAKFASI